MWISDWGCYWSYVIIAVDAQAACLPDPDNRELVTIVVTSSMAGEEILHIQGSISCMEVLRQRYRWRYTLLPIRDWFYNRST